jgi:hypothetical protein
MLLVLSFNPPMIHSLTLTPAIVSFLSYAMEVAFNCFKRIKTIIISNNCIGSSANYWSHSSNITYAIFSQALTTSSYIGKLGRCHFNP